MYKIAPKCGRVGYTRGLCEKHRALCGDAVKDGKITWEILEEMGYALPARYVAHATKDLLAAVEDYKSKKKK